MRLLKKWIKYSLPYHRIKKYYQDGRFKPKQGKNPNLWHVNQDSVARGVALGLFVAFLPLPGQMLIAATLALVVGANIPVSIIFTLVTNPITFVPMTYLICKVGQWVIHDHSGSILPPITWHGRTWAANAQELFIFLKSLGKPFIVGLPVVAVLFSLIGYITVYLFWERGVHWYNKVKQRLNRIKIKIK